MIEKFRNINNNKNVTVTLVPGGEVNIGVEIDRRDGVTSFITDATLTTENARKLAAAILNAVDGVTPVPTEDEFEKELNAILGGMFEEEMPLPTEPTVEIDHDEPGLTAEQIAYLNSLPAGAVIRFKEDPNQDDFVKCTSGNHWHSAFAGPYEIEPDAFKAGTIERVS